MPAVPKPNHGRNKPKRGSLTKITQKVRDEVNRRSMENGFHFVPVCERCGYSSDLTKAHLVNASQGGRGDDPANVVNLCGSHGIGGSDNKGGCHDWADNSTAGREWKKAKRLELIEYYGGVGRGN
jgi:hypothetical protein